MHTTVIHSLCYTHSEYLCFPPHIVIHTVYMATRHLEWNAVQYYYCHVHSHTLWGNLAMHRFKDHQIQTHSDRGTEPCTGSKTIRSKPVQTGALSLAQVQRSSDPNPFRQGHRALHRFKDHQIQTPSDRGTEPCTGSKTIRSKPVQTREQNRLI